MYSTLSWLSGSKALVKIYLKLLLNFSQRSISKKITKIVYGIVSFVKYYHVLIGRFEDNFILLVTTYFIFGFYTLLISYNVLR